MRNIVVTISFLLLLTQCQTHKKLNKFTNGSEVKGYKIPVQIFYPKHYGTDGKVYPLILFLHGAGERGDDNQKQKLHVYPFLVSDEVQDRFPCIVVAPQCPEDDYWAPVNRFEWTVKNDGKITPAMEEVMQIMHDIVKEKWVDSNRCYAAGLSMGGFGTLDILSRKPDWFAAGIVMCGGADLSKVSRYAHVPLWIFHGAKDDVVSVSLSEQLVSALRKEGGSPKFTVYPDGNHGIWDRAIREEALLPWLFSQKKH